MATVKWSGLIAGLIGSVGGMTFSKCRGQPTARIKKTGPKRNTSLQAFQRNRFVLSNAAWQGLTETEKDDWNSFALSPPETTYNAFGDEILLSGFQWFVRLYCRFEFVGEAPILTPPTGSRPSLPTVLSCELYPSPTPTCTVLTDITQWNDDDYCLIYAGTSTLATSITYVPNTYFMRAIKAIDYGAFDFTSAFIGRYGQPVIDQPAKVYVVRQLANGLRSLTWVSNQKFEEP